MSAWRGEVNLLDLSKPQYRPVNMPSRRTPQPAAATSSSGNAVVEQAMVALSRIGARRAG